MSESKRKALFQDRKASSDKFYDTDVKPLRSSDPKFTIPKTERLGGNKTNKMGPADYNTSVNFLPDKKVK